MSNITSSLSFPFISSAVWLPVLMTPTTDVHQINNTWSSAELKLYTDAGMTEFSWQSLWEILLLFLLSAKPMQLYKWSSTFFKSLAKVIQSEKKKNNNKYLRFMTKSKKYRYFINTVISRVKHAHRKIIPALAWILAYPGSGQRRSNHLCYK